MPDEPLYCVSDVILKSEQDSQYDKYNPGQHRGVLRDCPTTFIHRAMISFLVTGHQITNVHAPSCEAQPHQ